ncbi:hypothetical protein [Clostridium sp. DJ247]|uniref:hypothetical protein n=1 Tax=Clostridium sp. DJ247 TaxID=2726188 RepID=UPI001628E886|nr:hypothetical protein [Clostridium sp. DJ247]MBC2581092.1 hypothetical protein [Clostridium sp. DJ247]
MSKPQFNHLTTIVNGLINLPGNKTLSEIAKSVLSSKDKSCIYKYFKSNLSFDKYRVRSNLSIERLKQNIALEDILLELKIA